MTNQAVYNFYLESIFFVAIYLVIHFFLKPNSMIYGAIAPKLRRCYNKSYTKIIFVYNQTLKNRRPKRASVFLFQEKRPSCGKRQKT
jgi:hypothetical protein